ncbi:hypothetical protein FJK98_12370 [Micromonospora sp. HM134]|uniref:hypothetical protein n=1 Tax=unclassified Micromonospora TaxID=2617518 RepID=UPI00119897FD|nr:MULTISPECIES: hypothetical protein [unclassified Micromonospora]QDY07866.1 hypothetical protein FJK98_12370 [Micromonospora sp. HM134]
MTEGPSYGPDDVMRGLSLPRRVGLLVAGFGGLAAAVTIGLLLATEPGELPLRTRIAFVAMIGVGMAWAGFAGWALARRPLFAVDRVIAAWLAVTFSVLMTVGMVSVAVMRAGPVGILAVGGLGVALTVVASVLLARARAYRRALLARWDELERRNG